MSDVNSLSAESPWPGLQAYTEADRDFFFGRDAEIEQLVWLVRRNKLTVVFGPSGTGKSSLVQAGLFPKLRSEALEPHLIRLKHGGSLVGQVQIELELSGDTLWEGLYRLPESPEHVVVFDQFEEIFTLGDGRPESEEFLTQLGDLVENYYPASVRERLESGETFHFGHDLQRTRILLVLREDFVWCLDGLRTRMPSVMGARFAVQPFTESQALEAVEKPGREVVDSEVARQIVRFAASKRGPRLVDPAILCLLCRELNKGRPQGGGISPSQMEGDSESILSKFWEDSITALDEPDRQPVREFIENRLVSPNGFRTAAPRDEAAAHGSAIDALIDGRLVRIEERFGTPHIELTHDVLCPVVRKTREERRQRAEAVRREEVTRIELARSQAKRTRIAAVCFLVLMLTAVGFAVWAIRAQRDADDLRRRAENSAGVATRNRDLAKANETLAKKNAEAAIASSNGANMQREIAAREKEVAQTALTHSSVQEAADLAGAGRMQEAMAYVARALRIDADSVEARSWFTDLTLHERWWYPVRQLHLPDKAFTPVAAPVSIPSPDGLVLSSEPAQHVDAPFIIPSPDGLRAFTTSVDGTGQVWSDIDGKLSARLLPDIGHGIHQPLFSRNGRRIVTEPSRGTAQVWDTDTGNPIGKALKHGSVAAFSPDGRWIVSIPDDKTARVWNADTGEAVGSPMQHENGVISAKFSSDGQRVVTVSDDNKVQVWNALTGLPIGTSMQPTHRVDSAAFSLDGRRILTDSYSYRTVWAWDASTGKPIGGAWQLPEDNRLLAFSPDGREVVTIAGSGGAQVWALDTNEPVGRPLQHKDTITSAAFSPDGRWVVTASADNTARVWDAKTGNAVGVPLQNVFSAAFSPDGRGVVTQSADHTVRVWVMGEGEFPLQKRGAFCSGCSPDGRRVLSIFYDHNAATVLDAVSGEPVGRPLQHASGVNSAVFSPDGRRVVTASSDHTARVWEADTGKPVGKPLQHASDVNSAMFSPDGRRVVTASDDHTARLWDAETGKPLGLPIQHTDRVDTATFSPDGQWVLTASHATAQLWESKTGKAVGMPMQYSQDIPQSNKVRATNPSGHLPPRWIALVSPNGRRVLTAFGETARLWDASTSEPVGTPLLQGESSDSVIESAAFSPDGRLVLTESSWEARMWDADIGKPLGLPLQLNGSIYTGGLAAAFSRNGRRAASAEQTWTVLLGSGSVQDANVMGDFAEALGGYRVNEFGSLVPLENRAERIYDLRKRLTTAPAPEGSLNWSLRHFFGIL